MKAFLANFKTSENEEDLEPLPEADDEPSKISYLLSWVEKMHFLPQKIEPLLLKRFIHTVDGSLEEAKKMIKMNYEIRQREPSLFLQRDPTAEETSLTFEYIDMVYLPGITPENCKVMIYRFKNVESSNINPERDTKVFLMVADSRFCKSDHDSQDDYIADNDIQIMDLEGYTFKHLRKSKFRIIHIYFKFLQYAFPINLKAIHIINSPDLFETAFTIMKPFLNKRVIKMIHIHNNILDLSKEIPAAMLPTEYGGLAGTMESLQLKTVRLLEEKRDYLVDSQYWEASKGLHNL